MLLFLWLVTELVSWWGFQIRILLYSPGLNERRLSWFHPYTFCFCLSGTSVVRVCNHIGIRILHFLCTVYFCYNISTSISWLSNTKFVYSIVFFLDFTLSIKVRYLMHLFLYKLWNFLGWKKLICDYALVCSCSHMHLHITYTHIHTCAHRYSPWCHKGK